MHINIVVSSLLLFLILETQYTKIILLIILIQRPKIILIRHVHFSDIYFTLIHRNNVVLPIRKRNVNCSIPHNVLGCLLTVSFYFVYMTKCLCKTANSFYNMLIKNINRD